MKRTMEFSSQAGFEEARLAQSNEAPAPDAEFTELVQRQSRFVYKIAYSIVRNVQDAEDVTQESFLKLYRRGAWRNVQDERAFLARVVWRIAVDRIANREQPAAAEVEPASQACTPEQLALSADWKATIHRLIDALPEELRQPLALSSVDELNSSQIGRILGIPEGTVRSRLNRARQILKTKLTAITERGGCGR
ncbi:MAG TPA: RNA polymerase sigma factor [Bryobacteraceae bacterium]|jgi:RNA polymerase sigma-70 factor (ECF subfamily)|nr:RNA polymerase sigma factor [Bryobacteraceae bacterium]